MEESNVKKCKACGAYRTSHCKRCGVLHELNDDCVYGQVYQYWLLQELHKVEQWLINNNHL